ncbi:hypothetical protein DFJ73DRAFT_760483 [Zopfochytrium polystomum]|nr:hypothetical protein DFJ73DRAFT_760483 [Zopfochytrium polystomum]
MKFLASSACILALASAFVPAPAAATVVPKSITKIDAVNSTTSSLTLKATFDIAWSDPADLGTQLTFALSAGSDGPSYATGILTVPLARDTPSAGSALTDATVELSPLSPAAKSGAWALLSSYASNTGGQVTFRDTKTNLTSSVAIGGTGAASDVLQAVWQRVDLNALVLKKNNVSVLVGNPFPSQPLQFRGVVLNVTSTVPLANATNLTLASVAVQDLAGQGLGFTVPAGAAAPVNSTLLPTPYNLTLAQWLQYISQSVQNKSLLVGVSAQERVAIGNFEAVLSFKKIVPSWADFF